MTRPAKASWKRLLDATKFETRSSDSDATKFETHRPDSSVLRLLDAYLRGDTHRPGISWKRLLDASKFETAVDEVRAAPGPGWKRLLDAQSSRRTDQIHQFCGCSTPPKFENRLGIWFEFRAGTRGSRYWKRLLDASKFETHCQHDATSPARRTWKRLLDASKFETTRPFYPGDLTISAWKRLLDAKFETR